MGFDRIWKSLLPGTLRRAGLKGLSSRDRALWLHKLPSRVGGAGVFTLISGLAFAGYSHWTGTLLPPPAARVVQTAPAPVVTAKPTPVATKRAALQPGLRYVRRNNSVLRVAAKPNAKALARKAKGAPVTVIAVSTDGWAEVRDGALTGFMRASVLGGPLTSPK